MSMPGTRVAACSARQPGSVETSWRRQLKAATRVLTDFSLSWREMALTTRGTSACSSALVPEMTPSTAIESAELGSTSEMVATCLGLGLGLGVGLGLGLGSGLGLGFGFGLGFGLGSGLGPLGEMVATCCSRSLKVEKTSILTFSSRSLKRAISTGATSGKRLGLG